jgi:ABC-2 type transport system ATP-binding protein
MSGLDPLGRRDIRQIMQELRDQGTTVFFSTHILPDVEVVCDRVGIIANGATRKAGSLGELLGESIERVEVATEPCNAEVKQATQGLAQSIETRSSDSVFVVPDMKAANQLVDLLRRHKVDLRGMQVVRHTLEDLFVREAAQSREEVTA